MITLGIGHGNHDTSVAISENGTIIVAAEEERFNREKATNKFPLIALNNCLKYCNLKLTDVDRIIVADKASEFVTHAHHLMYYLLRSDCPIEESKYFYRKLNNRNYIRKLLAREGLVFHPKSKLISIPHHVAHAYSAYLSSPYENAAVLVVDGVGEYHTISIFKGEDGVIKNIRKFQFPISLGKFYGSIARYLGFNDPSKDGKLMGLAAYGSNALVEEFKQLFLLDFKLNIVPDPSFFKFGLTPHSPSRVTSKFIDCFGKARKKGEPITQIHKDIAFAAQNLLERKLLTLIELTHNITNLNDLCYAGGVALNCQANARIRESGIFKSMFIPSAPNDAGLALGAALFERHKDRANCRDRKKFTPFLGTNFNASEIRSTFEEFSIKWRLVEYPEQEAAILLSNGALIGWHQGRMEFGPRALGNRSILADPRSLEIRNRLNRAVKKRDDFRPFAPSVLKEYAGEIFINCKESALMIDSFKVNRDWLEKIPAVIHIDESARVQTVERSENPQFWDLINSFMKYTGIPVVLNTSFNGSNQPIVSSPRDAIISFVELGLDALIIGHYVITL